MMMMMTEIITGADVPPVEAEVALGHQRAEGTEQVLSDQ